MAAKELTQEERYEQMMHEPVQTLIPRMAAPTIVSMMVTAVYNMADTFFVSQINTSASGAVGIIFSLMAMLQAFAFMIGMGAGNHIARLLGQKKTEHAAVFASVCYFTELALGAVITGVLLLNLPFLVRLLGATETIAPYAEDYAFWILLAAPFIMCSFGMNNMLRFQGNAFYAMLGIMTGGVLNMVLDPLLIFGFDMGIAGAAIATAFSQLVSFVILTLQCNLRKSCISIRIRNFRPTVSIYRQIIGTGFPSLTRQGIASFAVILMNYAAKPYGDAAIAAMSIVARCGNFVNSAMIGFGQGFQPVCGFNFGAGNVKRVREAFSFCIKTSLIFLIALSLLCFLCASPIITAFRRDDAEVIAIGSFALRAQCLTIPLSSVIMMSNMLTQTVGSGWRATLVSMLRQGLCYIPLILFLPRVSGLFGIEIAQPIADIVSALIAGCIARGVLRDLGSGQSSEILKE